VEEPLDHCQYYYCPVNQKLELEKKNKKTITHKW